jgi:F-type H+-transporting ATPase subunit alpha
MAVEHQVAIIYALTNGYLDDVDVPQVRAWERDFHLYLRSTHPQILDGIREARALTKENEEALVAAIRRYAEMFADPHSPVGTDSYANSAILQETDADRRMGEDQLRMAARPESNAASARQSY